ncbi:MAG: hypothetical protein ACYTEQ_23155 [Planctomycetota bacterium]
MGLPGLLPGGPVADSDAQLARALNLPSGVFADFPGSTPKYALNDAHGRNEVETMARMFVQISAKERRQFVKSLPPETRELGRVLAGTGTRSGGGLGFVDFLLTNVQEGFQEKYQVVESLSDNFIVYTFGQKAPMFSYSGIALNSYQDDQRVWLMRLYRDVLRGTQLARRRKLVRIRYDSVIVSGIFVAHSQTLEGNAANYAQFSFSLIPTQYVIFTPAVGAPAQATTAFTEGSALGLLSTGVPDDTRLRAALVTRGTPTKKPAAQKTPSSLSTTDKRTVKTLKAQKVLIDRTNAAKKATKQPIPNTYGTPAVATDQFGLPVEPTSQ